MERPSSSLTRNASLLIIFPIVGMMGGIVWGVIPVWVWGGDPFYQVKSIVVGGFVGSVLGAATAVLIAVLERGSITSLKKLMAIILVASVVFWAIISLLRTLVANGSL